MSRPVYKLSAPVECRWPVMLYNLAHPQWSWLRIFYISQWPDGSSKTVYNQFCCLNLSVCSQPLWIQGFYSLWAVLRSQHSMNRPKTSLQAVRPGNQGCTQSKIPMKNQSTNPMSKAIVKAVCKLVCNPVPVQQSFYQMSELSSLLVSGTKVLFRWSSGFFPSVLLWGTWKKPSTTEMSSPTPTKHLPLERDNRGWFHQILKYYCMPCIWQLYSIWQLFPTRLKLN